MSSFHTNGLNEKPTPATCGKEQIAVQLAGDALDEQGHLLVAVEQTVMQTIAQAFLAHGAGIDRAHRVHECLQALLGRALIGEEDAFVFAGEGVAVVVLQQAAGAHDQRRLPKVLQHFHELLLDVVGKRAGENLLPGFFGALQIEVEILLAAAQPPAAVLHQVSVKHVRADVERVVAFQQFLPFRVGLLQDGPRQQHAERLAADQARADHPLHDFHQVRQIEILLGQLLESLVARHDHLHQAIEEFLRLAVRGPARPACR